MLFLKENVIIKFKENKSYRKIVSYLCDKRNEFLEDGKIFVTFSGMLRALSLGIEFLPQKELACRLFLHHLPVINVLFFITSALAVILFICSTVCYIAEKITASINWIKEIIYPESEQNTHDKALSVKQCNKLFIEYLF